MSEGRDSDFSIRISSLEITEATRIMENVYCCVNIAMVNKLKIVFERIGIEIWEFIDAAKAKPFGFSAFYPGPSLGGLCTWIDPFYPTWKARQYGIGTRFGDDEGEVVGKNVSWP